MHEYQNNNNTIFAVKTNVIILEQYARFYHLGPQKFGDCRLSF